MSGPSWEQLEEWASGTVSREDVAALRSALEDGAPALLDELRRLVTASPTTSSPLPALLALTFWRLHGVPFCDTLYHRQLLEELRSHVEPASGRLHTLFGPSDIALAVALVSEGYSTDSHSNQVALMSDLLVCSGRSRALPLDEGQAETAAMTAWLCWRLSTEPPGSCHLSPGRHERIELLLGGRSTLLLPGTEGRTLELHTSEALADDEVHLVSDPGPYLELYIPPAPIREDPEQSAAYSRFRSSGMTVAEALSAALS